MSVVEQRWRGREEKRERGRVLFALLKIVLLFLFAEEWDAGVCVEESQQLVFEIKKRKVLSLGSFFFFFRFVRPSLTVCLCLGGSACCAALPLSG